MNIIRTENELWWTLFMNEAESEMKCKPSRCVRSNAIPSIFASTFTSIVPLNCRPMRDHCYVLWTICCRLASRCDRRQLDNHLPRPLILTIAIHVGNRFCTFSSVCLPLRYFQLCDFSTLPLHWSTIVPLCSKASPVLWTREYSNCESLPFSVLLDTRFLDRSIRLCSMDVPMKLRKKNSS